MLKKIDEKIISPLEEIPLPIYIIPFLVVLLGSLRIFLEYSFICTSCRGITQLYWHGISSFLFNYVIGCTILYFLTGAEKRRILRISLFGFILILLPPVFDGLLFGRNTIYKYAFFIDEEKSKLYSLSKLLFSFSNDEVAGPALKIEIWAISILSSLYILIKRRNILFFIMGIPAILSTFVFTAYQQVIHDAISPNFLDELIALQMMGMSGLDHYFIFVWSLYAIFAVILLSIREIVENFPSYWKRILALISVILISILSSILQFRMNPQNTLFILFYLRFLAGTISLLAIHLLRFKNKDYQMFTTSFFTILFLIELPGIDELSIFFLLMGFLTGFLLRIFEKKIPITSSLITSLPAFFFWTMETGLFHLKLASLL